MRRALRVSALFVLLAGVFWAGRESTHGLTAFTEHWWCPIPLVLMALGGAALLLSTQTRPAA